MASNLTETLFQTKYKDDFRDSDHYHRILFNSGKVLQARELTQMQTILQKQIERFGTNIFKEGAAVLGGGVTVNNKYEFVKLDTSSNALPATPNSLLGVTVTGATSSVVGKIVEVVPAASGDPATIYVEYTNTTAGTAGATTPIRFTPGENLSNSVTPLTVQLTDTVANPAQGTGTKASTQTGIFFTQGHFVQADAQNKIVSKYSSTPDLNIGFRVQQRIFTVDDDQGLYDNQGALANLTAPGADRLRIDMTMALESEVDSDEIFVFYAKIQQGKVIEVVSADDSYNKIEDHAATRIKEINGDFIKKPFKINFQQHATDSANKYALKVSPGLVYLNGYRNEYSGVSTLSVNRALDTEQITNDVVSIGIGNYLLCDSSLGVPNIDEFETYNLKDGYRHTGTTIGTARIKSVEEDGANIRYHLMDIQMNAGQDFRLVRSIGVDATNYANPILENSSAVLKDKTNNTLLYSFQHPRIQAITNASYNVLRRDTRTTDGGGNASLPTLSGGELYTDTTDWIIARTDTGALISPTITLSGGGANASISGGPSSTNIEILYKKSVNATARTKTVTNTTITASVTTPATGAPYISLGKADVIDVTRVRVTDSDGADLQVKFVLDNGQRDNFYDVSRLILKGNQSKPTGNVFVRFNYYLHGSSGDFFAPTSYPSPYKDIPNYTSRTGQVYDLKNFLDFRSRKDDTGANFSAATARYNPLPTNTSLYTADVTYYLPRYDKLVATNPLQYIEGNSSFNPQFPQTPEGALELYQIKMNAGSVTDSDMQMRKVEAKGFTMKDLSRLEDRLDNLEEVTALSLLEIDLKNFAVLDSNGLDRTKSGFLVDNFVDHQSSAVNNIEYRASIDPQQKILRPQFSEEEIRLVYDSSQSTNTILKGDNVYMKYNHVSFIDQDIASGTENINPFAVITNEGYAELSPASDHWKETKVRHETVISGGTRLDNQSNRNFGNWGWNWGGVSVGTNVGGSRTAQEGDFNVTRVNRVVSEQTIREVINQRVVDVALIPFMRSSKVSFRVQGLKPNTRHYPFFDGVSVADFVDGTVNFTRHASSTTAVGTQFNRTTTHPDAPNASDRVLTSDAAGKIEGNFFIPNTDAIRFRTGTRAFELMDVTGGDANFATSFSKGFFDANGVLETVDRTVKATRQISIRSVVTGRSRISPPFQNDDDKNTPEPNPNDPLAQSFFVNKPNGVFITKVKIYFKTKDANIPVQLQIRPMIAGVPDNIPVPGAVKFLNPVDVNISNDSLTGTEFEFDEPVFLSGLTEYAIVLLAQSVDYNVYVAETEKFEVGSTARKVAKQPTLGSLFLSQNGSTWNPAQNKDMKFQLFSAKFPTTSAEVILENVALPIDLLPANPFQVDSGSAVVTVNQPNHGFIAGDKVIISGLDSSLSFNNGMTGQGLNGTRTIIKTDENFYTITADSASTDSSTFGGLTGLATQNIHYEILTPRIETLVPKNTTVTLDAKLTTGKSHAGNETQYTKDGAYTRLIMNEDNYFTTAKVLASDERETNAMSGAKSATLKVNLGTSDSDLAPFIDMQRTGMWLFHNEIDFQDSAGSLGVLTNLNRNNPLEFADETDPNGGSHLSKHVVKPVILESPSVGVKVLLSANKPSIADFDVYFKVATEDENFEDINWTEISPEELIASDENPAVFRDYTFLIGGTGGFANPFDKFILKIVMKSRNSALVPTFKDLRVIALAV